ncbi:hypothetical protein C7974DRAFT_359712 [Boeremia exigua]|uniref:uncharacterized protein n=1 Tax=Boeremia exigua TaxID=749465 RepID=UPI001E8EAB9B|nr:uncharacterized protein C7974DRAFT_359712 [Boeremia exigua]KAH6629735.1 hypothetical protein C7974DRAFT_359712 [Boeremia exigua]
MSSVNLLPCLARSSPSIFGKRLYSKALLRSSNSTPIRPLVHHQIYPQRSWYRTNTPSSQVCLRESLALLPFDKWGWVIYRCSYADDKVWAQFRTRIESKSRRDIAESDAPEISDSLEWKWVEDRATLDGASTAALRDRFRAWVVNEVAQQPADQDFGDVSRLRYFIKIDEEVMQSLPGFLEKRWSAEAFVKIVKADWEPLCEEFDHEKDIYEPIEGCTEKDVGWMRIAPEMVNAEFYYALDGYEPAWDDMFYQRPPHIVLW